ncbi:MAG: OadG family protein [Ruminococcus sp.]|nr:OadG family protein [Ruminococcus sp.]
MKNKISVLGLVLMLVLSLVGCGSGKEDEAGYNEEVLKQQADFMLSTFQSAPKEELEGLIEQPDMVIDVTFLNYGLRLGASEFREMTNAWIAGLEECGEIKSYNWTETKVTNEGITLIAEFEAEKRAGTLEFAFNQKTDMESMTINAQYSISEILTKAALNTVLGMGTVFVVLIFIAFIISLFGFIPALEKKLSDKREVPAAKTLVEKEIVQAKVPAPAATDDTELVAVISAAIAAATGTSTDGFVVRSIKRRKTNRWN